MSDTKKCEVLFYNEPLVATNHQVSIIAFELSITDQVIAIEKIITNKTRHLAMSAEWSGRAFKTLKL